MTIETRRGDIAGQQVDSETQVVVCLIRVSRKSANTLKNYLENRERILEMPGETDGEFVVVKSLLGQINRSLSRKRNNKNGEVDLALNIGEVGQFGGLLKKYGVRLPSLMRAMVEITGKMDKGSRGDFVEISKYCTGVLNQIESMPH